MPSLGLSQAEGFYYEQPIYIAEQNWWDLELSPQIRTKRGKGLYGMLRFVDSQVSSGTLLFGEFKEKRAYVDEFNLENNEHYGVNFKYENLNPLKKWFDLDATGQSGAYFDLNWMNDIEYLNLQRSDDTLNATSSQVFSRANLFYNRDQNYFASYVKYYLDLTQESNDETIQNLPTLHYHRYLETWLEDHLFYNVDMKLNNYYRKVGTTAREVEANVPVLLQGSFFDDYLDVSFRSQLYGKYIDFDNTGGTYSSGRFGRSTNTIQVGTHLTRGYENLTHSVDMDVLFVKNGAESRNGYFETYQTDCEADPSSDLCSYYNITDIEEATEIRFAQYLFGGEGSQILYHRLTQYINSDDRFTELENEITWQISPVLSLYSDTVYDHQLDRLTKQATELAYEDRGFRLGLSHFYEDQTRHSLDYDSSYLTADIEYRYDEHYNYFAKYAYDMEHSVKKNVQVGFLYSKRCWDFGLRYVELNRPVLEQGGVVDSIYDKYIYFTIILKPMGGSAIQYQLNDLLEGS